MEVLNWSIPSSFLGSLITSSFCFPLGHTGSLLYTCLESVLWLGEGVGEAAVPLPSPAVWRVTGPAFLLHLDLVLKLRSKHGLLLYWQQDF